MASFRLSKWYLDCVSERGETAIVYTGALGWGNVRLHYSSVLETLGERVETRHTLREQNEPAAQDGWVRWRSEALAVDGEWAADSEPVRETVFESVEGSIEWECVMPRAKARVGALAGFGYVERLSVTIPPWKLPIETLRWGRFTSTSRVVVWIDWVGDDDRRIVYVDGQAARAVKIADDRIEFVDGSRLMMDQSLLLRDGPLGTTALAAIPGLRSTYPARLLQVKETKWRSCACLEQQGGQAVEGWAIHEIVSWPK